MRCVVKAISETRREFVNPVIAAEIVTPVLLPLESASIVSTIPLETTARSVFQVSVF